MAMKKRLLLLRLLTLMGKLKSQTATGIERATDYILKWQYLAGSPSTGPIRVQWRSAVILALFLLCAPAAAGAFPVSIRVDALKSSGELKPIWRFFGADEPNYAYMPNGRRLIAELGALSSKNVYFRAHNLLNSGDGTPALKWGSTGVYSEDAQGKPVYDWTILDRIFDTYLDRGVRPYAQIGFMPKELSVKPEPYQHRWNPGAKYPEIFTGWAYPPKDYSRWAELVYHWAKHCV